MKKFIQMILIGSAFFMVQSLYALDTPIMNSPIGFWKTIDDVSGKPRAILHITETPYNTLTGRIVKTFPGPNESINDVCSLCQGERHNKRILGMVVMENLKQNINDTKEWAGGEILDPKTGKSYHCKLQVVDNGQKLKVRGYMGLPLFGRSQTWIKIEHP